MSLGVIVVQVGVGVRTSFAIWVRRLGGIGCCECQWFFVSLPVLAVGLARA